MVDAVSVCNQALAELGETLIASFNDETSVSTLCAQLYPDAMESTLTLHLWDFAQRRVWLARSAEVPPFGYAYMHVLPTDPRCLVVHETDQPSWYGWDIEQDSEGRRVLVSHQETVGIVFTAMVEDLNLWSPLARQVLVKVLASKLAKPLTGQNSVADLKWKEALMLLPEARRSDARQGAPRVLRLPSRILGQRLGSHSGVWPFTWPPGPGDSP